MKRNINLYASNPNLQITTEIDAISDKIQTKNALLIKIFEDELKDIYWSEKVLKILIDKMITQASSPVLTEALQMHSKEKKDQIRCLEHAFELIGKVPSEKKCKSIADLIEESEKMMNIFKTGKAKDTMILSSGQKIQQYEIGIYATLRLFASNLGLEDLAAILEKILIEEMEANKKLTEIAAYI